MLKLHVRIGYARHSSQDPTRKTALLKKDIVTVPPVGFRRQIMTVSPSAEITRHHSSFNESERVCVPYTKQKHDDVVAESRRWVRLGTTRSLYNQFFHLFRQSGVE